MKNAILLSVLCLSFGINAAENGPAQPTATSDFLNITGANVFQVIKNGLLVGAFTASVIGGSKICTGEIEGALKLAVVSYILGFTALQLDGNQLRCHDYTSPHLKPLSAGLQNIAGLVSLFVSTAFAVNLLHELEQV